MDAHAFAAEWQAAWNSHDLARIMSHYAENITFRSRKAIPLTGSGTVRGKDALRRYWSEALARQPDLHFTVTEVFAGHEMIVIAYTNHKNTRATETLLFENGQVIQASACHAPASLHP